MRAAGILLLLIAAYILSGELCRRRRMRLSITEELYRLVLHMRNRIGCYLSPPSELLCGFESPLLSELGFLRRFSESATLDEAFRSSGIAEMLGEDTGRIISDIFSRVGKGYLDDELKSIDRKGNELSVMLDEERKNAARDIKLIRTVTTCLAVGVAILLL